MFGLRTFAASVLCAALVTVVGCGQSGNGLPPDGSMKGELLENGTPYSKAADESVSVTLVSPDTTYFGGVAADGKIEFTLPNQAAPKPGSYMVGVRVTTYQNQKADKLKDQFEARRSPLRAVLTAQSKFVRIDIGKKTVVVE